MRTRRKRNSIVILCPGFPDCPDEPDDNSHECQICPWRKNWKKGRKNPTKNQQ